MPNGSDSAIGYAIPGCPRRVSALVIALCYSRYLYIELTLSQKFGTLVWAMDRGLDFFGGTTLVDIFDNMKTVVIAHNHRATQFNQKFLAYSLARNLGVRACTPGKGNEKGRGADWIRARALLAGQALQEPA